MRGIEREQHVIKCFETCKQTLKKGNHHHSCSCEKMSESNKRHYASSENSTNEVSKVAEEEDDPCMSRDRSFHHCTLLYKKRRLSGAVRARPNSVLVGTPEAKYRVF